MMSACGVICSDCPAYQGVSKGLAFQEKVADAWRRIYKLNEEPEHITCGGCLGSDEELFYTSRKCKARSCCRQKGLLCCAECSLENCQDLETAQTVWDEVPNICSTLSDFEFTTYARPYCDHRKRLREARSTMKRRDSQTIADN